MTADSTETDLEEDNITEAPEVCVHNPADAEAARFVLGDMVLATTYEVDGVRIVGYARCSLARQVPAAVESIFGLASFSPAAMLFEATSALALIENSSSSEEYDRDVDANADDSIQAIASTNDVVNAVSECLEVAEHFLRAQYQQVLLYVASYGKRFVPLSTDGESMAARRELADR